MNTKAFDPQNAFRFELGRGHITANGSGPRVLIPVDALSHLLAALSPEALKDFGHLVGNELGRRVAERLGNALEAPTDRLVDHLGGEWALMGLGSFGLELWGKAMVFTVALSPFGSQGDAFLSAVLEGTIGRALGRRVVVLPISHNADPLRLLITGVHGASQVKGWLEAGKSYGDVLSELNRGAGDSRQP
jgi:hypothetical protein